MGRTILTRAQLHALVWAKPLRAVAGKLGISDVGLAKICKRHDVPTPPQGHWTRVQMGKPATAAIVLPAAEQGHAEKIEIVSAMPIAKGGHTLQPDEHARREALLAREAQSDFRVEVRANPATLHPLAARVQKTLKAAKIDDYDCLRCSDPALPAVRVTPGGVPRAVALVDALARGAEKRSFPVAERPRQQVG